MVLGTGIVLAAALTPGALMLMLDLLQTLWDWMVDGVARLMAFLAGLFPQPEVKAFPIGGVAGPAPPDASILPELLRIPDYVRRVAAFLVSAFWLVLFGVCLWRIAAQISEWLRRQMQDLEDAEMETMQGAFRQDLLRMLRRIRRLSEWLAWLGFRLWGQARPEICSPEAAAMRRVYRALLSWSADGGCARRRSQTPHEFLERLVTWLPEARLQLAEITEHYVAVRYGGLKLDADAVKRVELIWLDVRHLRKRRWKGA